MKLIGAGLPRTDGESPWEEIWGDSPSTVDWPSAFHWRELMAHYPDAKVLLSVRVHESWARSMQDTICQIYFGDSLLHHLAQARYHVDPDWKAWVDLMDRHVLAGPWTAGEHAGRERADDGARRAMEPDGDGRSARGATARVVAGGRLGAPVRVRRGGRSGRGTAAGERHEAFKEGIMGAAVGSLGAWRGARAGVA